MTLEPPPNRCAGAQVARGGGGGRAGAEVLSGRWMVRLSQSPREAAPMVPCDVSMERILGYKVVELRAELRRRGFPTEGKKAELVARLASLVKENSASPAQAQPAQVKCETREETDAAVSGARSPLATRNGDLSGSPRRRQAAVPAFAPELAAAPPAGAPHRSSSRERDTECARSAVLDEQANNSGASLRENDFERLQAMDQAMEEAIADMERLDAQLAESDARVRQLQNELVNEKEQSAHVWGASQALRERATNCEAELIAERQARQEAEEMLQKCQQTARAAALQSQRQQRLSCAVMIVLVVAAAHLWWDSCMLLQ